MTTSLPFIPQGFKHLKDSSEVDIQNSRDYCQDDLAHRDAILHDSIKTLAAWDIIPQWSKKAFYQNDFQKFIIYNLQMVTKTNFK